MKSNTRPDGRPTRQRPSFIEEARRAQIIEAATHTVAELGYARASLARIAERAGISKSVISYHFDGKDELLEQVVHQFFDDTWAYMQSRIDAATSPIERIRAWVASELEFFAAHKPGFLAMVEIVDNHRRADGTRPFEGLDDEEIEALAEVLDEGQRRGEFRDFDPRTFAHVISQTMEGALGRWAYEGTIDLDEQIPAVVDFVEHAIRRESS